MENNFDNNTTEKALGWAEKMLELARKYRWFEWAEAILIATIIGILVTVFTHPTQVMDFFKDAANRQHIELLEKRQESNAEAQAICDRLLYQVGSSRVLGLEMHNSLVGVGGLPFLKASCTVQSLNDSIVPVDDQYQNTNLSLCPFSSYLYSKGEWYGDVEGLDSIDRSLKYKLMSNNVEYLYATLVPGKDKAIGFLFITYCGDSRPESMEVLQQEAQKAAIQLGLVLELRKA